MKKVVSRFAAKVLAVTLTVGSILGAPMSAQAQPDTGSGDQGDVRAIEPGTKWYDMDGQRIQAHGGQMFRADADGTGEKWWWLGEDKSEGRIPIRGVHLYSSEDMYSWEDEGTILPAFETKEEVRSVEYYKDYTDAQCEEIFYYFNEKNCIIERPKVLYNDDTEQWVLWFHSDGPPASGGTSRYSRALVGVAVSDNLTGPYRFLGAARPYGDAGIPGEGSQSAGDSRDMTVFKDDDGTAYLIYTTSKKGTNNAISIAKLNDSYTGLATDKDYGEDGYILCDPAKAGKPGQDFYFDVLNERQREAPAVFKYKGTYYMGVSTTGGWNPSFTTLFKSDKMLGRWTKVSNSLFTGEDSWKPDEDYMTSIAKGQGFSSSAGNSFSSQITYVVPLDAEKGLFLYMGDRWWDPDTYGKKQGYTNKNSPKYGWPLSDARYVWLPFTMNEDGTMNKIQMRNSWTLEDVFIHVSGYEPKMTTDLGEYPQLPETVQVSGLNGAETTEAVEWDPVDVNAFGEPFAQVKMQGHLVNRPTVAVDIEVEVIPKDLTYFIDCGTGAWGVESAEYEKISGMQGMELRNGVSDQQYSSEAALEDQWGYSSKTSDPKSLKLTPDGTTGVSQSKYEVGLRTNLDSGISYKMYLTAGTYIFTGGYYEWWGGQNRSMKPVISYEDGNGETQQVEGQTVSLPNAGAKAVSSDRVVIPKDGVVTFQVKAAAKAKPVISFLGVTELKGGSGISGITGIHVDKLPDKTTYRVGEELDTEGMVVVASASNAEPVILTEDQYEVSALDSSTEGEKTITVFCRDDESWYLYTDEFKVTVRDGDIDDEDDINRTKEIKITKDPDRMNYQVDDDFDPSGMVVKAVKKASDSNMQPVEVELKHEQLDYEYDFSSPGKKDVTVVYMEEDAAGDEVRFTDTVRVEVGTAAEEYYTTGIKIKEKPDKVLYERNESFDPDGMRVVAQQKASPSNAERAVDLTDDDLDYEYDFSTPGEKTVKVLYYGVDKNQKEKIFRTSLTVWVADDTEEGLYTEKIRITTPPDKTSYYVGDRFDPEGMVVTAVQVDRATGEHQEEVIDTYQISPQVFMTADTTEILVTYTATGEDGTPVVFRAAVPVTVRQAIQNPDTDHDGDDDDGNGSDDRSSTSTAGQTANSGKTYRDEKKGMVSETMGIITGEGSGYASWNQDGKGWALKYADGTMAAGAYIDDGRGGKVEQVAWEKINGAWYPFGADSYIKTGFVFDYTLNGWFYIDPNRGMLTGLQTIDGKQYYFNPNHDGRAGALADGTTPPEDVVEKAAAQTAAAQNAAAQNAAAQNAGN